MALAIDVAIDDEKHPGVTIVNLRGDLITENIGRTSPSQRIMQAVQENPTHDLLVNMAGVTGVDTAGIAELLLGCKSVNRNHIMPDGHNSAFVLCGLSFEAQQKVEVYGFDRLSGVVTIVNGDQEAALSWMEAKRPWQSLTRQKPRFFAHTTPTQMQLALS